MSGHLVIAGSSAEFSPCRRYRYALRRRFADGPTVMFVGLNPSTADEHSDDPTIRRCLGFARRWGYGTLVMANLYAWRATRPRDLFTASAPIAPLFENDMWLAILSRRADLIVAAWGANAGPFPDRPRHVFGLLGECVALGITKRGAPRHPLYVPADAKLVPFTPCEPAQGSA